MYIFTLSIKRFILVTSLTLVTACSSFHSQQPQQEITSLDNRIAQTRVVLVGETHNNYAHHLNQLEIIRKTAKKWGGGKNNVISIGLEMVQQPFQAVLDDYIAGNITEREMLKGVEWYSRWRFDFRLYRPIFDYAKQHKIPLIALNVPIELTRKISRSGMQTLTSAERKLLPEFIDKSNASYTARLKKVFGQHAHGKTFNQEGFNRFVDAQLAWDEGMAFAASKYLIKHPKRKMIILAGSGHLINREGIPSRLDRLLKLSPKERSLVVLSHSDTKYTKAEADFSLPTKAVELPPKGLIGIRMKDTQQGVQIASISDAGAANKAGIVKDDYLLQFNKVVVKNSSDVSLLLLDKKPNDKVELLIQRNHQTIQKTIILGG